MESEESWLLRPLYSPIRQGRVLVTSQIKQHHHSTHRGDPVCQGCAVYLTSINTDNITDNTDIVTDNDQCLKTTHTEHRLVHSSCLHFFLSFSSQNKQYRAAKLIYRYILGYDKPETLSMSLISFSSGSITALGQEVKFTM